MKRLYTLAPVLALTLTPAQAAAAALSAKSVEAARVVRPIRGTGQGAEAPILKAQVLLDRAHISPGVIDGGYGSNMRKALRVFQKFHGLPPTGTLGPTTWKKLTAADPDPVLTRFKIQPENVKGPFAAKIPADFKKMAALKTLAYTSPLELISEKFHTSPRLLKRLNPGVDFKKAGTAIVVPSVVRRALGGEAALVRVDKPTQSVRVYTASKELLAFYPATVGSGEFPSPSGSLEVVSIAEHPPFAISEKLEYARKSTKLALKPGEKIKIAAGPNNPVGVVWIALNKRGYGLHGTAHPEQVSKTASHGCVRLTNWDALELARLLHKGTPVSFGSPPATRGPKIAATPRR
jgi:lipoprotein-anchoring transpeptidase ErfK/SrfK